MTITTPRKEVIDLTQVYRYDEAGVASVRVSKPRASRTFRALSSAWARLRRTTTGSLAHPELSGEVIVVMEQVAHEGSTMIVVSHEMSFAREEADRVIYPEGGSDRGGWSA